jgi:thioredoxin 1
MSLHIFDDDNFDQEVIQSEKPVLVDFSAEWCGPCKAMDPIIEELASEYGDRIKIGRVDVDQSQKTAVRYRIMGVPTVILFQRGKQVDQTVGLVGKGDLEGKIRKLLD